MAETKESSSGLVLELMAKISALDSSSLAAVHQFLLRLELAGLSEGLQEEADILRQAGQLAPDLIEAAVQEHRRKYPYVS